MSRFKLITLAAVYHFACGIGRSAAAVAAFTGRKSVEIINNGDVDGDEVETADTLFGTLTEKWKVN